MTRKGSLVRIQSFPPFFSNIEVCAMDRIAQQFSNANKACFVSYICAGDPNWNTSLEVCRKLVANGVDVLEIGVPFLRSLSRRTHEPTRRRTRTRRRHNRRRCFEISRHSTPRNRDSNRTLHLLQSSIFLKVWPNTPLKPKQPAWTEYWF